MLELQPVDIDGKDGRNTEKGNKIALKSTLDVSTWHGNTASF